MAVAVSPDEPADAIETLIRLRRWDDLAARVEAGFVFHSGQLDEDEAFLLEAHLPTYLRGDWDGDDFHICAELPL